MATTCLDCGRVIPRGPRCDRHRRLHDRDRRPPPSVRYGPDYRARHADAIAAEPWCHWPAGCDHPITEANPLTADHPIRVADGGSPDQPLVPMCKHHNSGRRATRGAG